MDTESTYKLAKDYGIPIIRNESHLMLEKIAKEQNPKHILEIGKLCRIAKQNLKEKNLTQRAKVIEGDCLVELAKLLSTKNYDDYFDLIFLDGPKAQYDLMLDTLVTLLKPGGTLVVDNVLFRGYVEHSTDVPKRYKTIVKRLEKFIENCKNHKKLTDFKLISIEDGMIFAKKVK